MTRRALVAVVPIAILLLAGCSGGSHIPVSGTVTAGGKPVTFVSVRFFPDASKGNKSPIANGSTDGEGRFTLHCEDGKPGAHAGFYKVTIVDSRPKTKAMENDPYNADLKALPKNPPYAKKYEAPETTDLIVEVKPGNPVVLELK